MTQDHAGEAVGPETSAIEAGAFSPADLAGFIVAAYSGAMTMAKAEQSPAPLDSAVAILMRLLARP